MDLTYTARNQLATQARYSDLGGLNKVASNTLTYDTVGRLTNLQDFNASGGSLANYTYTYDLASRLQTEQLNGGATKTYTYDAANELTNDGTNAYSYDLNGNRTMSGYTTGAGNQLTNDGVWTYTYDAEGNLTKKSKGASAETWTYGYDNQNHMVWAKDSATDGGTVTTLATYVYDALGNRLEKDVWTQQSGTTTTTRFGYDGVEVWVDLNGTNALQTRYIQGDAVDQLFARIGAGGTAAWYLTDRLGSVRDIVNSSGTVIDHLDYDGFGNATESQPNNGDRYKWTGRETDNETGLQYNRARYYDPKTGRWISQDPAGFAAGDTNIYRDVHNQPTQYIDPSGLGEAESNGFFSWLSGDYSAKQYADWNTKRDTGFLNMPRDHVSPGDASQELTQFMDNHPTAPLAMGSLPLYGPNGNMNAAQAMTQAGYAIQELNQAALRPLTIVASFVCPPLAPMLSFTSSGFYLTSGQYGNAALAGIQGLAGLNPCGYLRPIVLGANGINGAVMTYEAYQNFANGQKLMGFMCLAGALGSIFPFMTSCFAAGTPLLTPTGEKAIEDFRPGDWVLSAPEHHPDGAVEPRQVEEVLTSHGHLISLHIGKEIVRTTKEHPFYVKDRGWVLAGTLEKGQRLRSDDGRWLPIDAVIDNGEEAAVYNLRVADYHTYFVGSRSWGFSIWAHNADYCLPISGRPQHGDDWHNATGVDYALAREREGMANVMWNQRLRDASGRGYPQKRPDVQWTDQGLVYIREVQSEYQSATAMAALRYVYMSLLGAQFGGYDWIPHP
jgi:RHS repeat-associated protein